jgi:signal peptidase I
MPNDFPPLSPTPVPPTQPPGGHSIQADPPADHGVPTAAAREPTSPSMATGMARDLLFYGVLVVGLAVSFGVLLGLRYLGLPFLAYMGAGALLAVASVFLSYRAVRKMHGGASGASVVRGGPIPHNDGFREVVETVVFVVVLVLLLKSFVAEAFVIPTGSMAETLWGYQKVVTCPSCGYQFPINASQQVDPNQGSAPSFVCGGTCPNCLQGIRFQESPREELDAIARNNKDFLLSAVEVPDPGWGSGDRVLVAKFLYDLLGRLPDRLDVVVFKYPGGNDFPRSGPYKNHVAMNYIKRLIGLPGETIVICAGKLYVLAPNKGISHPEDLQDADGKELQGDARKQRLLELWQKPFMHANDENAQRDARNLFRQGAFVIIRKSPETMLAMRRIVFDNDHLPTDAPLDKNGKKLRPRWGGEGAWKAEDDGKTFRCVADQNALEELVYQHIVRGGDGEPGLITDFMGYNTNQPPTGLTPSPNWAGDLMVEGDFTIDKAEGELRLELGKGADRFQARFDLGTGVCTLFRGKERLDSRPTLLKGGKGTYAIRFANIDQKLTLWVNNAFPFGRDGTTYEVKEPEQNGPTKDDLKPVKIGVSGGAVTVRHLRLWRDTYYTYYEANADGPRPDDKDTWTKSYPVQSYYVQPGHFLCLGDNSPASSDGRDWGQVPERLLLGRAVLVYYPFYFPVWPLNSQVNRVGMIK